MPTKTTIKSNSKTSNSSEKKSSKILENKNIEKKDSTKKIVVKRRKSDLKPTKASAVAIASQANRAKKKALIEKVAKSEIVSGQKVETSDNKIPLWVRIFFWCSLLLFCVSFYQAIIRPQIENDKSITENVERIDDNSINIENDIEWWIDEDDTNIEDNSDALESENITNESGTSDNQQSATPNTAVDVINKFFVSLSDRDFDWAFDLMIPALRGYADIRNHFTSFRMNPFLDWIEWWRLEPQNIEYIKSPAYWKDVYNFNLSYVMKSNQEKYEETREFGVNTSWNEPKISSIRCISTKCSYHPIFWPENFGLMR